VFLGGLLLSTFFTLILVPTLFSLTMDAKAATWDRIFRKEDDAAPAQENTAEEPLPEPVAM
jgi:hypothetical protein